MPDFVRPVLAAALTCGLALPLAAQERAQASADTVIATVGDVEITAGHMVAMRAQLPQQYQGAPDAQLFQGLLEQLIQQTALGQQLGEMPKDMAVVLDNEERALRASAVLREGMDGAITEEDITAKYDELFGNAEPTPEYNASHILVGDEETALEIKELLDGGADFAEMATVHSTGPSGPNGGQLGWFGPGMMVPSFEEAVVALVPGQISDPIQTQFGWHVIKLNDNRMAEAPGLEEKRGEVVEELQRARVDALIAQALEGVTVTQKSLEEIDPSFISNPSLFEE